MPAGEADMALPSPNLTALSSLTFSSLALFKEKKKALFFYPFK